MFSLFPIQKHKSFFGKFSCVTISLDFSTIKQWYYFVKEQKKSPEDGQLQDNAKADDEGGG